VGAKFLRTIDALSHIDPIFDDWNVIDCQAMSSSPLAKVRPRIAALVENNVSRDDWDSPDADPGYYVVGMTGNSIDPRSMSLTINSGGKEKGEIMLEAGDVEVASDPAIVTYPLFKAALLVINSIWSPTWTNACAFEMDYENEPLIPGMPLFPYSRFHIPWLAYLSAPLADGADLPAEILTERTPDGGLLMIAAEERLDPTNPQHLRRSRLIAETMIARAGRRDR
jgi:hypothetical protein